MKKSGSRHGAVKRVIGDVRAESWPRFGAIVGFCLGVLALPLAFLLSLIALDSANPGLWFVIAVAAFLMCPVLIALGSGLWNTRPWARTFATVLGWCAAFFVLAVASLLLILALSGLLLSSDTMNYVSVSIFFFVILFLWLVVGVTGVVVWLRAFQFDRAVREFSPAAGQHLPATARAFAILAWFQCALMLIAGVVLLLLATLTMISLPEVFDFWASVIVFGAGALFILLAVARGIAARGILRGRSFGRRMMIAGASVTLLFLFALIVAILFAPGTFLFTFATVLFLLALMLPSAWQLKFFLRK